MVVRVVRIHRARALADVGAETLYFKLDIGRLGRFIKPQAMPPFEGEDGYVEIEGPNTKIKVLRQVPKPTWL